VRGCPFLFGQPLTFLTDHQRVNQPAANPEWIPRFEGDVSHLALRGW
jgi:hypothetical protein